MLNINNRPTQAHEFLNFALLGNALQMALQLGLLDEMKDRSVTAAALSIKFSLPEIYLKSLLNLLEANGFILVSNKSYQASSTLIDWIDSEPNRTRFRLVHPAMLNQFGVMQSRKRRLKIIYDGWLKKLKFRTTKRFPNTFYPEGLSAKIFQIFLKEWLMIKVKTF